MMFDMPVLAPGEKPILLVGEQNPLTGRAHLALYDKPRGCSGHRLRTRILGLRRRTYLGWSVRRKNLCAGLYSPVVAASAAQVILERGDDYSAIVMLGVKVRRAFDAEGIKFFRAGRFVSSDRADVTLISFPHPSGLCHEWNDPSAIIVARAMLRDYVPHIAWGELDE